jgi:hypothetical protein
MKQMQILGLVVSVVLILSLITSVISKQNKSGESNQNLLNKPAEVKTQVNKALDATEKARQNALTEPKN